MKCNKIKEIFDPKLGARITHSQKILIIDLRSHILNLGSQITESISLISDHKSQITESISLISDQRSHIPNLGSKISGHKCQITNLRSHESGENLMMPRSLENLANLSSVTPLKKNSNLHSQSSCFAPS